MMFSNITASPSAAGSRTERRTRSRVPAFPASQKKQTERNGEASMNHHARSSPPEPADDPPDSLLDGPLASTSTAIVPFEPPGLPATAEQPKADEIDRELLEILGSRNIRHISPRAMAELALDLYAAGYLAWEEYAALAFQSELQPAFNRTIGALTGRKAEPDRPRDYITIWETRLAFELKHNRRNRLLVENAKGIVDFLRGLERPLKLVS